jgi:ATP-grasp domain
MPEIPNSRDKRRDAPVILLTDTSRYATPARMAIALSAAGARVDAICPPRDHCLRKTRAVRKIYPHSWFEPLDALESAIAAAQPDIVIPCDDRGVQDLHELYCRARKAGPAKKSIADLIERSLGPSASFPTVLSRHDLLKLAREENLRVPATQLVASLADLDAWGAAHAFPWVLKADGTCGGRGVRIVHSRPEAEQAFQEISRPPRVTGAMRRLILDRDAFWLRPWWKGTAPAVIVQTYVTGTPANCAAVCWQGQALAGLSVEVVSTQDATGPATVVRVVDNSEMSLAAARIASRLGLSGFIGLDFMIEEKTGAPYLIEMNPRCTPLCHLQLGHGRDMVASIFAQLSATPPRETAPATDKNLIAYFPRAWMFNKDLLPSCFQDIPQNEPDLVEELLHPQRNRRFIQRRLSRRRAKKAATTHANQPHPAA